jgi:phenylalanyl-tRNA synthetase beta chain
LGALHPKLNKPVDIEGRVYLFEIALSAVLQSDIPAFEPLSKFPAIRRDLALLVDESVKAGQIEHCLSKVDSDILKAFQLQHGERTLTDDEVDALINTVTETLEQSVGATIRS